MSSNRLIVVFGSGPGIGVATAIHFASKGLDVALLSRNAERLEQDVAKVRQANSKVKVQAYPVDLGDHNALSKTLARVEADLGPPEVVYYNAARIAPSKIGVSSPDFMLEDFKVRMHPSHVPSSLASTDILQSMSLGLFVAASWALPHLTARASDKAAHPSFLFTFSPLWDRPLADLTSLSMQKATQYNLMLSLKQMVEPQGVHVGGVNVAGLVSDEEPALNAKNIAQKLFELYRQDQPDWQWEIIVGDWDAALRKMSGK